MIIYRWIAAFFFLFSKQLSQIPFRCSFPPLVFCGFIALCISLMLTERESVSSSDRTSTNKHSCSPSMDMLFSSRFTILCPDVPSQGLVELYAGLNDHSKVLDALNEIFKLIKCAISSRADLIC
jgi:hypothetical protein